MPYQKKSNRASCKVRNLKRKKFDADNTENVKGGGLIGMQGGVVLSSKLSNLGSTMATTGGSGPSSFNQGGGSGK